MALSLNSRSPAPHSASPDSRHSSHQPQPTHQPPFDHSTQFAPAARRIVPGNSIADLIKQCSPEAEKFRVTGIAAIRDHAHNMTVQLETAMSSNAAGPELARTIALLTLRLKIANNTALFLQNLPAMNYQELRGVIGTLNEFAHTTLSAAAPRPRFDDAIGPPEDALSQHMMIVASCLRSLREDYLNLRTRTALLSPDREEQIQGHRELERDFAKASLLLLRCLQPVGIFIMDPEARGGQESMSLPATGVYRIRLIASDVRVSEAAAPDDILLRVKEGADGRKIVQIRAVERGKRWNANDHSDVVTLREGTSVTIGRGVGRMPTIDPECSTALPVCPNPDVRVRSVLWSRLALRIAMHAGRLYPSDTGSVRGIEVLGAPKTPTGHTYDPVTIVDANGKFAMGQRRHAM